MDKISNNKSWETILKKLIICQNSDEKKVLLDKIVHSKGPRILSFFNAHAANLVWTDLDFRRKILASNYLLRDGSGIHLFLSLLKINSGLNLNGTDLIPEILNLYERNTVIAIYGTKGLFLEDGVSSIKDMGFEKIYSEDGFQSQDYYLEKYKEQKPDLVILAMGMPKQEKLSIFLRDATNNDNDVLIINGGGIIDFLSRRVKRAPKFMRRMGIEWLYRFTRDPIRLWKRNLGSVVFILRALKFSRTRQKL